MNTDPQPATVSCVIFIKEPVDSRLSKEKIDVLEFFRPLKFIRFELNVKANGTVTGLSIQMHKV